MVKPIAYVGIGTQQNPNIQAPTKIDTPQYPDKYVDYAGYSKVSLSNNQFRLSPQTENNIGIYFPGGTPAGNYNINRGNPTQDYVIKFVLVSCFENVPMTQITFTDEDGNNSLTLRVPALFGGAYSFEIVPKVFKGERINITLGQNIQAADHIYVTFFGWYEDKG